MSRSDAKTAKDDLAGLLLRASQLEQKLVSIKPISILEALEKYVVDLEKKSASAGTSSINAKELSFWKDTASWLFALLSHRGGFNFRMQCSGTEFADLEKNVSNSEAKLLALLDRLSELEPRLNAGDTARLEKTQNDLDEYALQLESRLAAVEKAKIRAMRGGTGNDSQKLTGVFEDIAGLETRLRSFEEKMCIQVLEQAAGLEEKVSSLEKVQVDRLNGKVVEPVPNFKSASSFGSPEYDRLRKTLQELEAENDVLSRSVPSVSTTEFSNLKENLQRVQEATKVAQSTAAACVPAAEHRRLRTELQELSVKKEAQLKENESLKGASGVSMAEHTALREELKAAEQAYDSERIQQLQQTSELQVENIFRRKSLASAITAEEHDAVKRRLEAVQHEYETFRTSALKTHDDYESMKCEHEKHDIEKDSLRQRIDSLGGECSRLRERADSATIEAAEYTALKETEENLREECTQLRQKQTQVVAPETHEALKKNVDALQSEADMLKKVYDMQKHQLNSEIASTNEARRKADALQSERENVKRVQKRYSPQRGPPRSPTSSSPGARDPAAEVSSPSSSAATSSQLPSTYVKSFKWAAPTNEASQQPRVALKPVLAAKTDGDASASGQPSNAAKRHDMTPMSEFSDALLESLISPATKSVSSLHPGGGTGSSLTLIACTGTQRHPTVYSSVVRDSISRSKVLDVSFQSTSSVQTARSQPLSPSVQSVLSSNSLVQRVPSLVGRPTASPASGPGSFNVPGPLGSGLWPNGGRTRSPLRSPATSPTGLRFDGFQHSSLMSSQTDSRTSPFSRQGQFTCLTPATSSSSMRPFPYAGATTAFSSRPATASLAPDGEYVKGAAIEAWSKSKNAWCPGFVECIDGDMVYVNFKSPTGECYRKGIPKDHQHLRLAQGASRSSPTSLASVAKGAFVV